MEKSWECACVAFLSLLWKSGGTSPLWALTKELQLSCRADSVLQKPSPVCLQLLIHGTGSCRWESRGSSGSTWGGVTELCRACLTREEGRGMEGQSCTLPVSPWDTQAGQGEWGPRLPALFVSSAPSKRGELCRTGIHRANEEGGSGQLAAFALFTTYYKFVLIWDQQETVMRNLCDLKVLSLCLDLSGSAAQKARSRSLQVTG